MTESDEDQITIDRKRFVDLLEIDLWSKFQKRLWGVISGFLVLVTVAGLFGIPYFIESQTQKIFLSQSARYEADVRKITSYTKAYIFLFTRYENYHQRLRQDIYTVLRDLRSFRQAQADFEDSRFQWPDEPFLKILHENDPRNILNFRNFFMRMNLEGYEEMRISINETIHLENTILSATGSTSATHPARNGTIEGFIEDVKIRLLILAAYRNALEALSEHIFQVGSENGDFDARTRALEVESIVETVFEPSVDQYLSANWTKLPFHGGRYSNFKDIFRFYIEELDIDATKMQSIELFDVKRPEKDKAQEPEGETEPSRTDVDNKDSSQN